MTTTSPSPSQAQIDALEGEIVQTERRVRELYDQLAQARQQRVREIMAQHPLSRIIDDVEGIAQQLEQCWTQMLRHDWEQSTPFTFMLDEHWQLRAEASPQGALVSVEPSGLDETALDGMERTQMPIPVALAPVVDPVKIHELDGPALRATINVLIEAARSSQPIEPLQRERLGVVRA